MRDNSDDGAIERNYVQKWRFLVRDYERVKAKRHPQGRTSTPSTGPTGRPSPSTTTATVSRGRTTPLLPRKRGPKWKSRRIPPPHRGALELRRKGINRYEIYAILRPVLKSHTPAPSTIYAIAQRHGLNRLTKPMRESKRQIIKTRAGELGHLDCHYLSSLIVGAKRRHYLVSVLDDAPDLGGGVDDLKSLSVMFAALTSINLLNAEYGVRFEAILTDNGAEVASPAKKANHPMERMFQELGITTPGPTGRRPTGRSSGSSGR